MSFVIREFSSISEFVKSIDDELGELRKTLGDLLRRLEELRIKAEQERKLRELLLKLRGSKGAEVSNTVELKNIKIVLNPSPEQEVESIQQAIENINNRIMQLQSIRKDLEVLSGTELEVKLEVIYVNGLPKVILLKM
ncbi:MAG: hypothetical protein B6U85_08335 [Desulfurococcales archaeon ex4484_42]|nr:MAG: hypothetical protein B6U85_08335 [Desulfurococcales archaeon ex4484_42]